MSRRNESPADLLVKMPWPASAVLGVFAFVLLRWVVPALWGGNDTFRLLAPAAVNLAPVVALGFGVIACLSFFLGKKRASLVDSQTRCQPLG